MSINLNHRLSPAILQADREAQVALAALTDYQPANTDFSQANVLAALTAMGTAQQAEILADSALDAARDAAVTAEWQFHNAILGAKDQVIAQYGVDADQVNALGLKKKSERRRRSRTVPEEPAPAP